MARLAGKRSRGSFATSWRSRPCNFTSSIFACHQLFTLQCSIVSRCVHWKADDKISVTVSMTYV